MKDFYYRFKAYIRSFLTTYNQFAFSKPYFILGIVLAITLAAQFYARKLPVKTDFFELLPKNYRSIDDLQKVIDRVGGVGNLIIAVETTDFEAGKKYVEDVASDVKKLPKSMVTDVNYNIKDIRKFYEDNVLFYLEKGDLIDVKNRLAAKLDYEKKKNNPLYFFKEFLTPVDFSLDDIREKYEGKTGKTENSFKGGYITGENGTLFAIMIKPKGSAAGMTDAKKLIVAVEKILDKHPPANYHASIQAHLCGNFKSMVEEYDVIMTDVVSTISLVFLLVGIVIFIFLGTLSSILLLLLMLGVSSVWTMGLTYLQIGQLNSQTAFLTSLVVGTGVNYGVIYLARYYEERRNGLSVTDSLMVASNSTFVQTFLASTTTAVSFVTLMFAHTRGFSQFGFIGAVGCTLCWVNTVLLLPVFIFVWEKLVHRTNVKKRFEIKFNIFTHISPYIIKHYKVSYFVFFTLVVLSALYGVRYYSNRYETDFSKLRNVQSVEKGTTAYWDDKVGRMFGEGTSLTPGVVVVDTPQEAEQVCESIEKKMAKLEPKFREIASCYSVNRMLPKDQEAKLPIIKEVKNLLYSGSVKFLDDKRYNDVVEFREKIKTRYLNMSDLPYSVTKNFDDIKGNKGVIVVVNPLMEQKLTENLTTFAELIRENTLADGRTVYSSGEAVIYADLLKAISIDGPVVSIFSFILVVLFILLSVRNIKDTAIIISTLVCSVIIMVGLIAFFDIKLNFFNYISIPLMFGIGVDYGANIYVRYKEEGNIKLTLDNTGQAVLLCSLTTVVSYITLLIARNQALVSFAKLALIGEAASLFGAFIVLPAILITIEKFSKKQSAKKAAATNYDITKKSDSDKQQDCFIDYQ